MRAMVRVGNGSSNRPALLENTPAGGRLGGPDSIGFSDSVADSVTGADTGADTGAGAGTGAGTGADTDPGAGTDAAM